MQFLTLAASALSLLAPITASAAAVAPRQAPKPEPLGPNERFELVALRSGSPVHFTWVQAANSRLYLKLPAQNASCDAGQDDNRAKFYVNSQDRGLYLASRNPPPQQIWTIRSWMGMFLSLFTIIRRRLTTTTTKTGQGVTGYTTGVEPLPRNGERGPFVFDEYNNLSLNGTSGFLACPGGPDGAYTIWTPAGLDKPAGIDGCLGVSLRASPFPNAPNCLYTQATVSW